MTTIKKEEFDVTVKHAWNNQYQGSIESFDDFDDALEYAKPYCLAPMRLNELCLYEPSVEICAYERVFNEDGDEIESEMTEVIDAFYHLGLSEEDILAKAELDSELGEHA